MQCNASAAYCLPVYQKQRRLALGDLVPQGMESSQLGSSFEPTAEGRFHQFLVARRGHEFHCYIPSDLDDGNGPLQPGQKCQVGNC